MAINGHLWPFRIIFKALWRPPMAIPDPGKGPNSSPRMCPDLTQPRSTQIHQFGAARSTYGHKRAIYGLFEPFWDPLAPPMAIPDLGKGPNTSPRMCTDLIQPRSTLIHQFGAARPAYGPKRSISGNFGPFWGPMAPPNGHYGPGKGSQHFAPDVHGLDPTLIHSDPPVWSCQACLWPQKGHFWPF